MEPIDATFHDVEAKEYEGIRNLGFNASSCE
jgi:hypothetical protein